jgi:hypothetical protein
VVNPQFALCTQKGEAMFLSARPLMPRGTKNGSSVTNSSVTNSSVTDLREERAVRLGQALGIVLVKPKQQHR